MPQQDHDRQCSEKKGNVKPLEKPTLKKGLRMTQADNGCAPHLEEKEAGKPHLPVKDRRAAAAELGAPVADP